MYNSVSGDMTTKSIVLFNIRIMKMKMMLMKYYSFVKQKESATMTVFGLLPTITSVNTLINLLVSYPLVLNILN